MKQRSFSPGNVDPAHKPELNSSHQSHSTAHQAVGRLKWENSKSITKTASKEAVIYNNWSQTSILNNRSADSKQATECLPFGYHGKEEGIQVGQAVDLHCGWLVEQFTVVCVAWETGEGYGKTPAAHRSRSGCSGGRSGGWKTRRADDYSASGVAVEECDAGTCPGWETLSGNAVRKNHSLFLKF